MKHKHLFPWWAGYLLISPLRKLSLDPDRFLSEYITEGMTVIDAGCAMGYFSLPAARMAGETGKVICVDVQEKMLATLQKRAEKAGLDSRIKTRLCTADWLMIDEFYGKADVAIAFGVIHEAPDEAAFISDIARALKPGGRLIIGEPKSPVPEPVFHEELKIAAECGLALESEAEQSSARIAVLRKL
jgi:ubiquinone/menaquinone biosynthesis C-methylase UbiE